MAKSLLSPLLCAGVAELSPFLRKARTFRVRVSSTLVVTSGRPEAAALTSIGVGEGAGDEDEPARLRAQPRGHGGGIDTGCAAAGDVWLSQPDVACQAGVCHRKRNRGPVRGTSSWEPGLSAFPSLTAQCVRCAKYAWGEG